MASSELVVDFSVRALSEEAVETNMRVVQSATTTQRTVELSFLPVLDLDPEVISAVLGQLTAHNQAVAVQVCKLFALIISQLERAFLSSACADSIDELKVALGPKLVSPPSVGILFSNGGSRVSKAGLRKLAHALPPRMHLVGGASQTVVGVDAMGSQSHEAGVFSSTRNGDVSAVEFKLASTACASSSDSSSHGFGCTPVTVEIRSPAHSV